MASVVSRAWRMVRSGRGGEQPAGGQTGQTRPSPSGWGLRAWSPGWGGSWSPWGGGWSRENPQGGAIEEFWEAPEKLQHLEGEGLGVGGDPGGGEPGWWSWWSRFLPPWSRKTGPGFGGVACVQDADGDFSDYGTPPPSPPPPRSPPTSPFRLFLGGLAAPVLPEHDEICFNLLRHLFDLLAVGFLRAASRPALLFLELMGVRGALRLWLHGMAMFLVSTAGVAGLLWAVQEHLPQLALLYGLVQALVISVSLRRRTDGAGGAVATETEGAEEPGGEPKADPGSVAGP